MTNSQLGIVLALFFIALIYSEAKQFKSRKQKRTLRFKKALKTNFTIILQGINDCTTLEQLDNIEAKTCKLIFDHNDHSLTNNSRLLIEHFNLRRYQLEGRIPEAELCADKIEVLLREQNPCGI